MLVVEISDTQLVVAHTKFRKTNCVPTVINNVPHDPDAYSGARNTLGEDDEGNLVAHDDNWKGIGSQPLDRPWKGTTLFSFKLNEADGAKRFWQFFYIRKCGHGRRMYTPADRRGDVFGDGIPIADRSPTSVSGGIPTADDERASDKKDDTNSDNRGLPPLPPLEDVAEEASDGENYVEVDLSGLAHGCSMGICQT